MDPNGDGNFSDHMDVVNMSLGANNGFADDPDDIAAMVADEIFGSLKAPVKMVTAPHAPVPFSPALEDIYIPSVAKIEAAVREVMGYSRAKAAE